MLRRITKIASLLVAMVSVMPIVPAKAAEVKKIDATEGTIYSGYAKGNGIYFTGEINGKDEAAYYISEDGEYHKIDGLDAGYYATNLLINKYLVLDDDNYVDLTDNYKALNGNITEDLEDEAETIVRKKIRADNDRRFDKSSYDGSKIIEATMEGSAKFLSGSNGLAIYDYTLKNPGINKTKSTIYSDLKGNYVDADYNLGSLKVCTTSDSVIIKNTEDTYEIKDNTKAYELKAELKEKKYITSVANTIYRYADLTIYRKEKGADDATYVPVTNELGFGKNGYNVTSGDSVTVLQKFLNEPAANDIDGIKYSKNSSIYFIADEDGNEEYLLGRSAADAVAKVGAATGGKAKIAGSAQALYGTYLDVTNKKIYSETLNLKSKNGFNYIDIGDYDSSDTDTLDQIPTPNGLACFLDDGYIKIWDGNESFVKLYKVDGSMDDFSISTKDNLIVWNEDDGVYSVIHNITKTAAATTDNSIPTTAGWVQNVDNTWNYILENGIKKTGWLDNNGTWYFLNSEGIMKTGWINDNGTWYFCNASGAMLSNTTIDGYQLGANGAWIN
jgi:hypothetical protein